MGWWCCGHVISPCCSLSRKNREQASWQEAREQQIPGAVHCGGFGVLRASGSNCAVFIWFLGLEFWACSLKSLSRGCGLPWWAVLPLAQHRVDPSSSTWAAWCPNARVWAAGRDGQIKFKFTFSEAVSAAPKVKQLDAESAVEDSSLSSLNLGNHLHLYTPWANPTLAHNSHMMQPCIFIHVTSCHIPAWIMLHCARSGRPRRA